MSAPPCGRLLKRWRDLRKLSQLDLAHEAGVSARHLSFIESGRSKPSREMLMTLADALDVPLRERNALLNAAGFATLYRESAPDDAELQPVLRSLEIVLEREDRQHERPPAAVTLSRLGRGTPQEAMPQLPHRALSRPSPWCPGTTAPGSWCSSRWNSWNGWRR